MSHSGSSGTFGWNLQRQRRYRPGMDLRMSEDERQAFLAGVHIGVISIEREDGRRSRCRSGMATSPAARLGHHGTDSLKSKLLHQAQRFSRCVHTEEAPFYSYVSVDGPVVSVEADG